MKANDTAIKRNFVHKTLVALINYIKHMLKNIAYTISPKSNPDNIKHGEDIEMVEMIKFSDYIKEFQKRNTTKNKW